MKAILLFFIFCTSLCYAQHGVNPKEKVNLTFNYHGIVFELVPVTVNGDTQVYVITCDQDDFFTPGKVFRDIIKKEDAQLAASFLRTWLTAVDNGVNGKFYGGVLPGIEGEADSIIIHAEKLKKEHCNLNSNCHDEMCSNLTDIIKLANSIRQEASSQGKTGLFGQEYY